MYLQQISTWVNIFDIELVFLVDWLKVVAWLLVPTDHTEGKREGGRWSEVKVWSHSFTYITSRIHYITRMLKAVTNIVVDFLLLVQPSITLAFYTFTRVKALLHKEMFYISETANMYLTCAGLLLAQRCQAPCYTESLSETPPTTGLVRRSGMHRSRWTSTSLMFVCLLSDHQCFMFSLIKINAHRLYASHIFTVIEINTFRFYIDYVNNSFLQLALCICTTEIDDKDARKSTCNCYW